MMGLNMNIAEAFVKSDINNIKMLKNPLQQMIGVVNILGGKLGDKR